MKADITEHQLCLHDGQQTRLFLDFLQYNSLNLPFGSVSVIIVMDHKRMCRSNILFLAVTKCKVLLINLIFFFFLQFSSIYLYSPISRDNCLIGLHEINCTEEIK